MKNKFTYSIIFIFIFSFCLEKSHADVFSFESTEINVEKDGTLIKGKGDVKITDDQGIEIFADNFLYDKSILTLVVEGSVKIYDNLNKIDIFGEKFIYDKSIEKIYSTEKVSSNLGGQYSLSTEDIIYLVKEKKISSNKQMLLTDKLNNKITSKNFVYSINDGIFKSTKFDFIDSDGNEYVLDTVQLNTNTNEIAGKDLEINFNNLTFGNSDNNPRLKGRALFSNKKESIISKGVFTTCKKNDDCPPWTLSADEVIHDKVKKTINYKKAVLRLYDTPVFYFPKFFHPDPTVKRQSGFLMPTFADNNNLGASLAVPYYHVISDNKDLTVKPRFYSDNSVLLNSEYRVYTKKSKNILDASFINNKLKSEKDTNSKTHFFSNSKFILENSIFDQSDLEINLQQVSNDTYLKTYKLDSSLVKNTSTLHSFLNFNGYNEDIFFSGNIEVYEDLTKKKNSDKFEYILPNISIDKTFNSIFSQNGSLTFDGNAFVKQYDTNVEETNIINNFKFDSFPKYTASGFVSNYSLILKNVNSNSKNSTKFKNKSELQLLSSGMFGLSYPLKKMDKYYNQFLTPKMSFRYSPNNTKNIKDSDRRIDMSSVYSFNRIQSNETLENDGSITIGSEYLIKNKTDSEIFKLDLATVFRSEENKDLPTKSTLGKKTSNIFGEIEFTPNEYFNIDYNFSLDNDLRTSQYDHIKADIKINNFINTFEFLEENGDVGDNGYWNIKSSFNFDKQNSISINKRRNTKTNLNEFYNLVYEYKNDCLTAALEYNKEFYEDGELKPNEELFFSLTIIPFSKVNSPNVN